MSAANLCEELARRGVTLSLVPSSGRLSLEGDAVALDARVLADVSAMKPEIIALLKQRESSQHIGEPMTCREFIAGASYDSQAATAEAWRAFGAGEILAEQRDNLLSYARQ
jgi:hypothetical protein